LKLINVDQAQVHLVWVEQTLIAGFFKHLTVLLIKKFFLGFRKTVDVGHNVHHTEPEQLFF
jgi:hypothetical protein